MANEFTALMSQSFANSSSAEKIIVALNDKRKGLERAELCETSNVKDGGDFSETLNALIASGFVMRYVPFGMSQRHPHYKLFDPFCLFFLRFVKGNTSLDHFFFQQHIESPSLNVWRGLTYELVCMHHVNEIKAALGLTVIRTETSLLPLSDVDEGKKAQIDLIINRADNVATICEVKFSGASFEVSKKYYEELIERSALIATKLKKKQSMQHVLITTFGLKTNNYSSFFDASLCFDDLFR